MILYKFYCEPDGILGELLEGLDGGDDLVHVDRVVGVDPAIKV